MSSLGTSPVFVVFIIHPRATMATTTRMTARALRFMNAATETLYLSENDVKKRLKPAWKRFSFESRMMMALSAGDSVRALNSEMATAMAIVNPNCV